MWAMRGTGLGSGSFPMQGFGGFLNTAMFNPHAPMPNPVSLPMPGPSISNTGPNMPLSEPTNANQIKIHETGPQKFMGLRDYLERLRPWYRDRDIVPIISKLIKHGVHLVYQVTWFKERWDSQLVMPNGSSTSST